MSILIKSMEMPKNCQECRWRKTNIHNIDYCDLVEEAVPYLVKFPDICPLSEIVSCKDCAYFDKDTEYNKCWCNRTYGATETKPEHFCSYGKRKRNEMC